MMLCVGPYESLEEYRKKYSEQLGSIDGYIRSYLNGYGGFIVWRVNKEWRRVASSKQFNSLEEAKADLDRWIIEQGCIILPSKDYAVLI